MDHTALVVNLLVFEREVSAPVVEDKKTRIDDVWMFFCHRHVADVIDGLIKRCVGIEVSTELHTIALKVVDHVLAREVLRTVESHVLKEVSKTTLAILLKD